MSADVHGLSGAYAVDALDAPEREAVERHLAECDECQAEVAGLREAAVTLSHLSAVAPPAALRSAVLESIRVVRPLAPVVPDAVPVASPEPTPVIPSAPRHAAAARHDNVVPLRPRRRAVTWLAGVAAAAVIAVGAVAWSPWDRGSSGQVSASERVLHAKDAQRYTQTVGGARATIVRSTSLGKSVLVADNMPLPPEGKAYQVWYTVPGKGYVSAGVMPHDTRGRVTFTLDGDSRTATAAGITVEPSGGSTSPTTKPIAAFSFA